MIRIVIADDHQMFIDGIKSILGSQEEIVVVGEAANGRALLARVESLEGAVDVALLDINMPEWDGMETCSRLNQQFPHIRSLMLTMHHKPEFIRKVLKAGAAGYLLKNTGKKDLIHAIQTVHQTGKYYSEAVTRIIMDDLRGVPTAGEALLPDLTPREKDVLRLIISEYTTGEIAEELFISTHTVETHRKNLLSKTGARNIAGLVKIAIEKGLLE